MARVRKALVSALGATAAAIITALVNGDKPETTEGWAALVGGSIGLGAVAGIATWRVPNAGVVNASIPAGSRLYRP